MRPACTVGVPTPGPGAWVGEDGCEKGGKSGLPSAPQDDTNEGCFLCIHKTHSSSCFCHSHWFLGTQRTWGCPHKTRRGWVRVFPQWLLGSPWVYTIILPRFQHLMTLLHSSWSLLRDKKIDPTDHSFFLFVPYIFSLFILKNVKPMGKLKEWIQ